MKVELILIEDRPVGYNLVPENPDEQNTLKVLQSLHFLANCKQKRIQYDGISTDKQDKPDCMYFIQRQYASLPPESEIKQLILKMSGKYIYHNQ
ncbi:MAG: hypothetical protein LBT43_07415 [Prevotella sp.]|jgi:hypothetical protein|nr:hypothetical protein [Prevotella sp.]